MRCAVQAGALSLETPYKAIEPAHERSSSDTGRFTQPFYFGERGAKLVVCRIDPLRQFLHDRDRHSREFPYHAHERFLRDTQGDETVFGADRRIARHIAEDPHLTDDLVGAQGRYYDHRSRRRFEDDLGLALDDQIRCVGRVPLLHQPFASVETDPLAHEGQELQLRRLDLGKDRHSSKQLEFLFQAHFLPPVTLGMYVSLIPLRPATTSAIRFL